LHPGATVIFYQRIHEHQINIPYDQLLSSEMSSAVQQVVVGPDETLLDLYAVSPPFAYVTIVKNRETGRIVYKVVEPPLTKQDGEALDEIKRYLMEMQYPNIDALRVSPLRKYLRNLVRDIIDRFRLPVSEEAFDKIFYYVERDMLGYGRIDVLMRDAKVEDISCNGVGVPIYVWHAGYESIPTNISFESAEQIEKLIVRLASKAGKQISIAQPIVEGALPEGYRLHATLSVIGDRGGSFTIRKFKEIPFSIVDLIIMGSLTPELAAYLWLLIEAKKSLMIIGGTASGKTTTLNAVATFIHPEMKIVTIEEVRELMLPHENWVPLVTRPSSDPWVRDVTLYELLKTALRMRPDYIIVGEVRGEEAFTLFQAIATGHAGMCTLHAENVDYALKRLTSKPLDVPEALLPLMNVYMLVKRLALKDRVVRRVTEVYEVFEGEGRLVRNLVYSYNPVTDRVERSGKSVMLGVIARETFRSISDVEEELRRREELLTVMAESGITSFNEVSRIVREYYINPATAYYSLRGGSYTA